MSSKNNLATDGFGREFLITREFDAPRELVWRAWTEPQHLAQWWGPHGFTNPVCDWEARPGGKIYDVMRAANGMEFPMHGEFRELVAPERLVLACGALDEQGRLLFEMVHTVTLAGQDGKTKLTIRSRVTMTTPSAGKYLGGYEAGMTQSLEKLAAHLAQKSVPFVIERTFDASATQVWQAITDREMMKEWYFELAEFKPETGFEFDFTVEHKGMKYCHRCKVTEVMPQKRLAYTWRYDGHAGDSLVIFDLFAEGEKTRLKLTHLGLESFPPLPCFARGNFAEGWTQLIGTSLNDFLKTSAQP